MYTWHIVVEQKKFNFIAKQLWSSFLLKEHAPRAESRISCSNYLLQVALGLPHSLPLGNLPEPGKGFFGKALYQELLESIILTWVVSLQVAQISHYRRNQNMSGSWMRSWKVSPVWPAGQKFIFFWRLFRVNHRSVLLSYTWLIPSQFLSFLWKNVSAHRKYHIMWKTEV